jgi:hypothetical protein
MERSIDRNAQLEKLRNRYQNRGKEGKTRLLDEFCEQYGYERKYAIKLLSGAIGCEQQSSPPGPEPKYEPVLEIVENVWGAAEQLCGKRLESALPLWLPHYERRNIQKLDYLSGCLVMSSLHE